MSSRHSIFLIVRGAALLGAMLLPALAFAQQKTAVTEEDLARTKAQIKQQMDALTPEKIEETRRKIIVPQQQGANDEAMKAFRPKMPNLDALPKVQTQPNVDVGALAGQFLSQMKPTAAADLVVKPSLYVFITLAIPPESLQALVVQAEKAGATLVLRGMVDNSLKQTSLTIGKLVGKHKLGLVIDPEAFDRYGITRAPSFVLTKVSVAAGRPCADKFCAPADGYALVTGDVSLDYALERIAQRAPKFKNVAQDFLKRMRS